MDMRELTRWWIETRDVLLGLEPRDVLLSPYFIGVTAAVVIFAIWRRRPVFIVWYAACVAAWLLAYYTVLTGGTDAVQITYAIAGGLGLVMVASVLSWWLNRRS